MSREKDSLLIISNNDRNKKNLPDKPAADVVRDTSFPTKNKGNTPK